MKRKNFIICVSITILLLLDIVNIRSLVIWEKIGINVKNINVDMWSALLIASMFYIFEVKRERNQLIIKEKDLCKRNEHEASKFNLDNFNEINYYQLCQVADSLKSEFQIKREIYKKYILCEPQVKEMVLELANCKKINELSMDLIREELRLFVRDTNAWSLGECLFNDGFKYLHRAKKFFDDELPLENRYIYINPYNSNLSGDKSTDIYLPIDYFIENQLKEECKENLMSPYEVVENKCRSMSTSDSDVCFYLMELINNTIYSFQKNGILKKEEITCEDTDIEYVRVSNEELVTFEDYYYYTLLNIHNAYNSKISESRNI